MTTDTDEHLAAIAAGDADAFGRWVAGVESRLRESLRSFAAQVDVEAVVQECLLRVWQVAERHEPDGRPESLLRLAVRIARNLALDEVRRARLEPVDDGGLERAMAAAVAPPPALDALASDPFLRQALSECRDALRGKPAEAFTARLAAGGCEPDEVLAARLGMRPNTFLQNFTRARKALAECLERRNVDLAQELAHG
jgi:RNA polymerase sigma-70 factor (ECF subfamily)